jgi:hypothetical protein
MLAGTVLMLVIYNLAVRQRCRMLNKGDAMVAEFPVVNGTLVWKEPSPLLNYNTFLLSVLTYLIIPIARYRGTVDIDCGAHSASVGTGDVSPSVKRQIREFDRSPPSNVEVTNHGAIPPPPPPYVFRALCLIKPRDTFTFFFTCYVITWFSCLYHERMDGPFLNVTNICQHEDVNFLQIFRKKGLMMA